jgi:TM2 domain-containing membrane protein YozV
MDSNINLIKRKNEIQKYFDNYGNYFPIVAWADIKEYLQDLNDEEYNSFLKYTFKNPNKLFWTAFPLGIFGIDRFILGDTGLGIVKLLTLGQFLIGFIIDCFTIFSRTRSYNYEKFVTIKIGHNSLLI